MPDTSESYQHFVEIGRQMSRALGNNPEKLQALFDLFPLGIVMTDIEGRIVFYNQAHSKIDDMEPEEMMGRLEIEVMAPVTGPNIMKICQKTAEPILGYIYPYRTPKGRVVNAAYWAFPIYDEGQVKGTVCFTQPLLGEYAQRRAYSHPAIQWPGGSVPINVPQPSVVGGSRGFKKALQLIKTNANNPFPLLIAGETGSGKEMLAKMTHQSSKRRHGPYLALNCSAIPGTLLEGLLFGTVKGSFTGAIDRPGFFEEANGGTLYLDEVDSMSLDLQPKLLRVIQEMKVSRVGSTHETRLDLKIISSIGSSPQKALSSGALRPDLFYRLAVVVVNIPPLRERLDDMEMLIEHFLNKYNNILGKEALKLDERLKELMRNYHWPGNVRELEHMLAGALALVQDENVISLEHIPDHYIQAFHNASRAQDSDTPPIISSLPAWTDQPSADPARSQGGGYVSLKSGTITAGLGIATSPAPEPTESPPSPATWESGDSGMVRRIRQEEKALRDCLIACRGNLTKSAKMMGISRQLFTYRLLKHGLDFRDFK